MPVDYDKLRSMGLSEATLALIAKAEAAPRVDCVCVRQGLASAIFCVPKDTPVADVPVLAEAAQMAGTRNGWSHPDPVDVIRCADDPNRVHYLLNA